jgi:hypothetical protein
MYNCKNVIMYIRIMGRGGNMENTEKQVIDIEQLANDLNDKAISKNQVLEKYGIKDGKMKRLLKTNGYMYNQKSRKWQLESENAGSGRDVKVTYRMPNELYKAVKLQAIFEGVNATDIIVKALEGYIPKSTKEIIQQNEK